MERDDARTPPATPGDNASNPSATPGNDARNPSVTPGPQAPREKPARFGSNELLPIGLLLAACLVIAALVPQLYRDGVTLTAARWMPQRASTLFSSPTSPSLSAQHGPSTAETAPAQAAPPAPTGPQDAASAPAGVRELMELQQATARDVANLKQAIEQLRAKQDQVVSDNSKALEQLRAKQEDMARLLARVSEQSALPKTPPLSAGPTQPPQTRMRLHAPRPHRQYSPRWRYYDDDW
jgi:hypothetical protein